MLTHHFPSETPPTRLDVFLSATGLANRSKIQTAIKEGLVLVDGTIITKPSFTLQNGEHTITWKLPEDFILIPDTAAPLKVYYEDEYFIIAEKPAGIVTHPTNAEHTTSFIAQVLGHYPDIANAVIAPHDPESQWRPGVVHRLDAGTSGAIIIARTTEILLQLQAQFKAHAVQKTYQTLLWGNWPTTPLILTNHLARSGSKDENRFVVVRTSKEGREAILEARPLQHYTTSNMPVTLAEINLHTGRTHQIRVQCHHIGHPVLGDTLYSHKQAMALSANLGITRQLLHSASITLTHPVTGALVSVNSPLPADFAQILTKLKPNASVE